MSCSTCEGGSIVFEETVSGSGFKLFCPAGEEIVLPFGAIY
jgi:hypothetical protein